MLNEYALEPAMLNSWRDFCQFTAPFSFEKGRLISEFPKMRKWKRMVLNACTDCLPRDKKRIEEKLTRLDNKFLRLGRGTDEIRHYDSDQPWFDNAIAEHARRRFHAIIAADNPDNSDFVLSREDWDNDHVLLKATRGRVISRQVTDFLAVLDRIVRTCDEILLIDPYFDPDEPRFFEAAKQLITVVFGDTTQPLRVEVHTEAKPMRGSNGKLLKDANRQVVLESAPNWDSRCNMAFSHILRQDESVRIVRWVRVPSRDRPHARYVLTERGGVIFDFGLDEGKPGETTDVTIMPQSLYEERWPDYQVQSPGRYTLLDKVEVRGA